MITLQYFASIRESLGKEQESLELPGGVLTVQDLVEHLGERDETWRRTLQDDNVLVAVNQVMTRRSAPVSDGDEVAFFPPVTGG